MNQRPEDLTPSLERLAAARVRDDFRSFAMKSFNHLNPGTKLVWNWHLDYLCFILCRTLPLDHYLNPAPHFRRLQRLIINVPPRSLKSHVISTAFKAFILGHFPHERIVGASYSGKLATKFNLDLIKLISAPWYQEAFPNTRLDKETEGKIITTRNGHSIATSPSGTVTGEGGNFLLADDIVNPEQAESPTERGGANNWFTSTYLQRPDDEDNVTIIVVMQRLHEEDLTGFLLARNKDLPPDARWLLVKLPSYAEETRTFHYTVNGEPVAYTWEQNTPLQSARWPLHKLDRKKIDIGSYAFAAQYQQNPAPKDGGMLKLACLGRFTDLPHPSQVIRIGQSWDTAIKAGTEHDFSVCTTWIETPAHYYLWDVQVTKLEYPQLKALIPEHAARFTYQNIPLSALLIEDRASGQQLLQDLRRETKLPLIAIQAWGGKGKADRKIISVAACAPIIETGAILIQHDAEAQPWWGEFWKQMTFFPNGKNDDIPDSLAQYLNWSRANSHQRYRIRSL